MKSSKLIKSAWEDLKGEPYDLPGQYERRLLFKSPYSIYAGLNRPSNSIYISISVPTAIAIKVSEHDVEGFKVSKHFVQQENKVRVHMEISGSLYEEIFLIIASDLVDKLITANDEGKTALILNSRLAHWKKFMQASGNEGLSRFQQIGLFGELIVLKSLLSIPNMSLAVINAWCGPHGRNQDYLSNNVAIEVKTTSINDSARVRISNEYQLDYSALEYLFLCHICLEERHNSGVLLPDLIDEIFLSLETAIGETFIDALAQMGYHDTQRALYLNKGYIERSRSYYIVNHDFPTIIHSSLMPGINDVSYQVDLNAALSLKTTEQNVFQSFMGVV